MNEISGANGSVEVASATADIGPGTYTMMAQIAAEMLGGPLENVSVKLGAMEDKRTASNEQGSHNDGGKLGLAVRPLTEQEQQQGNVKGGLVVERASGPAAEAGIQPGDVVLAANGAPINSADDLRGAVEKSKGHIALLIQRGDARLFVPVRVG